MGGTIYGNLFKIRQIAYDYYFFYKKNHLMLDWFNFVHIIILDDSWFSQMSEACGQYLFTSLRDGNALPVPSALDAVEKDDEHALVNMVCVNLDEYARAYDDKAVKKTLSIPAWLNTACEDLGVNYSKVLKDALIAKLQTHS